MSLAPTVGHASGLPVRGDVVLTDGGATGRFVGRDATGTVWIAYRIADYERVCAAFDRRPR